MTAQISSRTSAKEVGRDNDDVSGQRRREQAPPRLSAGLAGQPRRRCDDRELGADRHRRRPDAIRAILGFARKLYDDKEFNYVAAYADHGFVEDYTSMVRGEPIGSVVVIHFNEAGQTARIVVNHRPPRSVLLWSQLMGEYFAGTRYAQYFVSHDAAEALYQATKQR
jgi:hypothetical protein